MTQRNCCDVGVGSALRSTQPTCARGSTDMRCPYCGCENTQVKDSRPTEENAAIRRRRICEDCGGRFTTFERVQLREIIVIKRSGRRVPFDRDKLSALGRDRAAQAADPARAHRAHGVGHRAPARKHGRAGDAVLRHRRAGDGGAEGPRSRRLRALRLGLPRLPRGGRLPRGAGRDRRSGASEPAARQASAGARAARRAEAVDRKH